MSSSSALTLYLGMLRKPYLPVDIFHRKVKADDLVVDEKFHSSVILQQSDQFTVCNWMDTQPMKLLSLATVTIIQIIMFIYNDTTSISVR